MDFDYKPSEEEIVPEESGDTEQENPKIPPDPPEGETVTEQAEGTEGEKSTASQQDKPTLPKPPHPQGCSRPQTDLDPPTFMRTRQQQRAQDLLAPLTPEEAQTRENNISHIKHLREAIKKGIQKWNEDLRKETNKIQKAWMEPEKEGLERWLEDLEMILRATEMSPVYITTVREEWIKAAQQKPTPTPEDPENPPSQPS